MGTPFNGPVLKVEETGRGKFLQRRRDGRNKGESHASWWGRML